MSMLVPNEFPSLLGGGRVAIVGEAPGAEEEAAGRPFVGASGKLLNNLLTNAGLLRGECYVGNVCQSRPPNNKITAWTAGGSANPEWGRIEQGLAQLLADLERLRPNVVIALGATALWALTGEQAIGNWRGSVLTGKLGLKIVPTYHPSYIFKQWHMRCVALLDLRRAASEAAFPEVRRVERVYHTEPASLDEARDWIATARKAPRITFDIENFSRGYVTVFGFATSPRCAFSIPMWGSLGPWWSVEDEATLWGDISALLADARVEKCAQYGIHDRSVLGHRYAVAVARFVHDTQVAAKIINPELPADLGFLASIYAHEPYWKHEGKSHDSVRDWPAYYRYNGKDCAVTFEIWESQERHLDAGAHRATFESTMRTLDPLLTMGLRGVRVDLDYRAALDHRLAQASEGLLDMAERVLGTSINPDSPDQMRELLYKRLGYAPVSKRVKDPSGGGSRTIITADDLAVAKCGAARADPALVLLRGAKHYATLRNHTSFELDERGRARCEFNPKTETGRLGASKWFDGTGYNLQNVPRKKCEDIRAQFIPDPGRWLGSADLEKAEAMVVAWLCGDEELIRAFREGADVHRLNGARIFAVAPEAVTPAQREDGKVFKHAGNYDVGYITLWEKLLQDGQHFEKARVRFLVAQVKQDRFIARWHAWTRREIERAQRVLVNPFGRVRQFLGRPQAEDGKTFREALAQIPQSTVADVVNRGLYRIAMELPEVELLLQVHDELVVQIAGDETHARAMMARVAECMRVPMQVRGVDGIERPLVIPVAWKIGHNWKECH